MAGIIFGPILIGIFVGTCILSPYIPGLSLFGAPVWLGYFGIYGNLSTDYQKYWNSSFSQLEWWNYLYAVLSVIGILPSFILVPPGALGIIIAFISTPIWGTIEILIAIAFLIYFWIDPSLTLYSYALKAFVCFFKLST